MLYPVSVLFLGVSNCETFYSLDAPFLHLSAILLSSLGKLLPYYIITSPKITCVLLNNVKQSPIRVSHYAVFDNEGLEVNKTQKKTHLNFKSSMTKAWQLVSESLLKLQRLLWSELYFNNKGKIATINLGFGGVVTKEKAESLLQDPQI